MIEFFLKFKYELRTSIGYYYIGYSIIPENISNIKLSYIFYYNGFIIGHRYYLFTESVNDHIDIIIAFLIYRH